MRLLLLVNFFKVFDVNEKKILILVKIKILEIFIYYCEFWLFFSIDKIFWFDINMNFWLSINKMCYFRKFV